MVALIRMRKVSQVFARIVEDLPGETEGPQLEGVAASAPKASTGEAAPATSKT